MEYIDLSKQSFPNKDKVNNDVIEQINSTEFDAKQFFPLIGNDGKIKIKLYVTKAYCKK